MLTGPIYENKTFFLISTELLRQNAFSSVTATVPTQLQRNGDFSQNFGSTASSLPSTIRSRRDSDRMARLYVWDPFQNNMILMNLWSKVGVKVLGY